MLTCGHTLRSMGYNCRACRSEYVDSEQAQMIARPEFEPPLKLDDSLLVGGRYKWDFISRYINGFRLQLAAEGKKTAIARRRCNISAPRLHVTSG